MWAASRLYMCPVSASGLIYHFQSLYYNLICLLHSNSLCVFFSFLAGKDSKAEVTPASPVALVPEEKVSFSLYALSVSTLTVAKIRKVYNKLDSKAIAKQVCCSIEGYVELE